MKRIRLSQWSPQVPRSSIRVRPSCPFRASSHQFQVNSCRLQSTSTIPFATADSQTPPLPAWNSSIPLEKLPSPPPAHALQSAKLAALHSRLSLPSRLPVETLARALVDSSADPSSDFNNSQLAMLGSDILGYHTSEHLLCHYPRLPTDIFMAAQWAFVGPTALSSIAREWGVEHAAEPGGEVDSGLLQLRIAPIDSDPAAINKPLFQPKRGMNWRVVHDDQFGEMPLPNSEEKLVDSEGRPASTLEDARNRFVQAIFGAVYLHCGRIATNRFFASHVLSRKLDMATLFNFREPTRDLSRLCAREGFQAPVARLISETGRHSRHPVFVVGVFSGKSLLGEGAGASLDEARIRAAAAALRSWYLYSPQDVTVPSSVEGGIREQRWQPNYVDCGEVVV